MLIAFVLSSILVFYSYEFVDQSLSTLDFYVDSDRKRYIQKNIVKGIYLMILSLFATLYFCFFPWDNTVLKTLAACYVSNDIVGLYRCDLPTSTKIHHATSGMFLIFTYTLDFVVSEVGSLLVYYTYFSSLAFAVNIYLGLRLCFEIQPPWLYDLRKICKWWYLIVCFINWTTQLYLMSSLNLQIGVYSSMILLIVMDDVVLLKWLFKEDW